MGLLLITNLAACNDRDVNFSQYPGFDQWYAANPPVDALPTTEEEALLQRYRPQFRLAADQKGPIDFYRDYIAQGRLIDGQGNPISNQVTKALLNLNKSDPTLVFIHLPEDKETTPTVYGRISHEPIRWPGCSEPMPLTFLTYHLVFRSSGLPAGVPAWQSGLIGLVADLDDWHQLDHYTAVTLVLAPLEKAALTPIAAIFQQHNYQRTYLLKGKLGKGRLVLPDNERIDVDIAIRSNELYPHAPARRSRRAISFMDVEGARYLIADGAAPWLAADDVTDPAQPIEPTLRFLPPSDAFYVFQGWLGERRRLPGRDGPPGADYNVLPPMKSMVHQLALSYWHEGANDFLELYDNVFKDGRPDRIDPTPFIARLHDDLDLACS